MRVMKLAGIVFLLLFLVAGVQASTQLVVLVKDETTGKALDGAEVYVNSQYIGRTGIDGGLTYIHPATSDLEMIIKKLGYRSWSGSVGRFTTMLNVVLELSQKTLEISVYDVETIEPVHRAEVSITNGNTTVMQKTDSSGKVQFEVQTDTSYDLEISASGYQTYTSSIDMGADDKNVQKYLTRSGKFVFSISDASSGLPLEGAEVRLDENSKGYTDSSGQLQVYIPREKEYLVEVIKQDYIPYSEEVYLSSDDALLFVPLSMSHYWLSVSVSDPEGNAISGAEVDIVGEGAGVTDSMGIFGVNNIIAGNYMIDVSASGYDEWSEDVPVSGSSQTVYVKLNYSQVPLNIKATEPGGKAVIGVLVLIDGKSIGFTDVNGNVETNVVSGTSYVLSLSKEGYISKNVGLAVPVGSGELSQTIVIEHEFPVLVVAIAVIIAALVISGVILYIRRGGISIKRSRKEKKGRRGKRQGGKDL